MDSGEPKPAATPPRVTIDSVVCVDEAGTTHVRPAGSTFAVNMMDGQMTLPDDPVAHLPIRTPTAQCAGCGEPLATFRADQDPADRAPCSTCGSSGRNISLTLEAQVSVDSYVIAKRMPADPDRSLPEKGITRAEAGVRRGRDGRRVFREARYDPTTDEASERVVDAETGEVIVDKVECMKEKYFARGRWSPHKGRSQTEDT